jgi:ribosomal protein L37E
VARDVFNSPAITEAMLAIADRLITATTLGASRELEAQAANIYFSAWNGHARARFAPTETVRIPEAWERFTVRTSPLHSGGHSPRNAADPINALLNYGYALAEAECRLAALAVRLDPGLGIVHTDQKTRDGFALDLLEPLRPVVERHLLGLIDRRTFRAAEFHETRDGRCRILPPLTHHVAELLLPELARAVARPAETVAHALAHSSPAKIDLRTPLSRTNVSRTQSPGRRSQNRSPKQAANTRRTCQRCGADLYGSARKLCPTCWPVMRNSYLQQVNGNKTRPPQPVKPSTEELSGGWTLKGYQTEILPGLADVSLRDIERATGLCNSTCSRLKRGIQIPNPKHWAALAQLADLVSWIAPPV